MFTFANPRRARWSTTVNPPPVSTPWRIELVNWVGMRVFFQAEVGIRDLTVTGVQTCALPISDIAHVGTAAVGNRPGRHHLARGELDHRHAASGDAFLDHHLVGAAVGDIEKLAVAARSEERRVGEECRSRWSTYH